MSAEQTAPDLVGLWTSSAFVEEVRAWVAAQLELRGSRLTGEWEQPHTRVWSSTIRFETTRGGVWFKVNARGTAQEPGLLALLGEIRPRLTPELVAYDDTRAWSLTRDGGPMLRSKAEPDALWDYWEKLLPRYAEAQRTLADHRPRLLAAGVPDRSPAQLPMEYRRLLARLAAQPTEDGGLTAEQASALEQRLPGFDHQCAELAVSPVADTLQHDDLHSNNICWPGEVEDLSSVRIIDWGDASVGHPFGTMLATLNSIAFHAGVLNDDGRIDDPRVLRIRDAYLEPFIDLGSRKELLRWVRLARGIGCVTRALAWESALQEAPAAVVAEVEYPIRSWLLELLQPWADMGARRTQSNDLASSDFKTAYTRPRLMVQPTPKTFGLRSPGSSGAHSRCRTRSHVGIRKS